MALIVFKIREINKYIIPIIAPNTHFFDKEIDVANGIIDYNDTTTGDRLTDLEKLLFDLKRGWGYYYNPLNPEDFPLEKILMHNLHNYHLIKIIKIIILV